MEKASTFVQRVGGIEAISLSLVRLLGVGSPDVAVPRIFDGARHDRHDVVSVGSLEFMLGLSVVTILIHLKVLIFFHFKYEFIN